MALSMDQIESCGFYEINPAELAPNHPDQLKKIRVLMVNSKTESSITVSFPSESALRTHFNEGQNTRRKTLFPALDEKYEMHVQVATQVFVKRLENSEDIMGAFLSSWLSIKNGSCCSKPKSSDMVRWGKRKEEDDQMDLEIGGGGDEGSERGLLSQKKRKRNGTDNMKNKKARSDDPTRNQATNAGKTTNNIKNSGSRWTEERYKSAEQNMLKVMKEKGAVFSKQISRPELRLEARKWIGDTGLLDHLLKHMAGKLAPGGKERFRRRENTNPMEYWLESADLMNIRKEAGVQDPYWIPPPGWQPGDNPNQDPVCARKNKQLEERLDELERLVKELTGLLGEAQRTHAKESYD